MIGFKVVSNESDVRRGKLLPYYFRWHEARPYWRGKWRRRQNGWGPLTIFKTLLDARAFVDNAPIYEAEYELSRDAEVWCPQFGKPPATATFPPGTVLADRIRLIRLINSRLGK